MRTAFPFLTHHPALAYLDSAATCLKPQVVLDAMVEAATKWDGAIARGSSSISAAATEHYESARRTVARFVGAQSEEIVFTRNTTEGINMVAETWGRLHIAEGDEILITALEHHSNMLPWQRLAREKHARLIEAPVQIDTGRLDLEAYKNLITPRTKLVALPHVSNVYGEELPVREIISLAHGIGARVLIDGAQAAAHIPLDLAALGVDFYACSGHKLYAPTGIGVLYIRRELAHTLPPYQLGGGMVGRVTPDTATYADPPYRFEAGTPHALGAAGMAAACTWLMRQDRTDMLAREHALMAAAREMLGRLPGITVLGGANTGTTLVSFVHGTIHAHDIGTVLDSVEVIVRTGQHCAQPLHSLLGIPASVRASVGVYTTLQDIERLVAGVEQAITLFT